MLVQTLLKDSCEKIKRSVRLPRGKTEIFPSNIGLNQECNMNPISFNLFINNINEMNATQLLWVI